MPAQIVNCFDSEAIQAEQYNAVFRMQQSSFARVNTDSLWNNFLLCYHNQRGLEIVFNNYLFYHLEDIRDSEGK